MAIKKRLALFNYSQSLLLGRSPWMAMSPPTGSMTREAQDIARVRSISIASVRASPFHARQLTMSLSERKAECKIPAECALLQNYMDGTCSGANSQRSVRVQDGNQSDPFLRPVALRQRKEGTAEENMGSIDYDPVTGEELPALGAPHARSSEHKIFLTCK